MKFRMLVRMKEGTVPVPHAAPALSDDDVAPVRELSHRGSHSGGGETPFRSISNFISMEKQFYRASRQDTAKSWCNAQISAGKTVKRIQMLIGTTRLSSTGENISIIPAMTATIRAP